MSVQTYYNWTADSYPPVKLQLQWHTLMYLRVPVCFSVMIAFRYRTRPTQPRPCNFKFKPTALCTLLCAHSLWCILSTFYEAITLSANYLPPLPVCYFTVLFQSLSEVCPHEWRTGSGKWQTIVIRKMWMQSVQDWCIGVSITALFINY